MVVQILDGGAPPKRTSSRPRDCPVMQQGTHHGENRRVRSNVSCFPYGVGIFGAAEGEVRFATQSFAPPPSLPSHTPAEIAISTTPSDRPHETPLHVTPVLPGSPSAVAADPPPYRRQSLWELGFGCDLSVRHVPQEIKHQRGCPKLPFYIVRQRHLRTLQTRSDPPLDPVIPSSHIFPSLETLVLYDGLAYKRLSFSGEWSR